MGLGINANAGRYLMRVVSVSLVASVVFVLSILAIGGMKDPGNQLLSVVFLWLLLYVLLQPVVQWLFHKSDPPRTV